VTAGKGDLHGEGAVANGNSLVFGYLMSMRGAVGGCVAGKLGQTKMPPRVQAVRQLRLLIPGGGRTYRKRRMAIAPSEYAASIDR